MVGGAALPNIDTRIKLYLIVTEPCISPAAERDAVIVLSLCRQGRG
jgi:hypothetical protein